MGIGTPNTQASETMQPFSEEDRMKWQSGAERFRQFVANKSLAGLNKQDSGELRAMFLGEKPACFRNTVCMRYQADLANFGLVTIGEYTYDPNQVGMVMQNHASEFANHGLTTPVQAIKALNSADMQHYKHTIRGIILGFPLESVQKHEYQETFKIHQLADSLYKLLEGTPDQEYMLKTYFSERHGNHELIEFFTAQLNKYKAELGLGDEEIAEILNELRYLINARGVDVYGVDWIDYGERSEESEEKQRRLRTAFEETGIMDMAA